MRLLGDVHLDDVQALLTAAGIVVPFALEEDEIRAIKSGKHMFMIHFINTDSLPPFRILFEREDFEFGNPDAQTDIKSKFSESPGDKEE